MAEVGLLPFARVALQVAERVLPPYRSRFSKHQFTQPQLLAILCLMRYEDWTFRETEVRLGEHRDLREVLQLQAGGGGCKATDFAGAARAARTVVRYASTACFARRRQATGACARGAGRCRVRFRSES